jgi:RNA polymerase I specific initiation factor
MQLNHVFALTPVYKWAREHGDQEVSKKRKRSVSPSEDESEGKEADVASDSDSNGERSTALFADDTASASASGLSAEQLEQYRVAGLSSHEDIPPRPFPAAEFPSKKTNILADATEELSHLTPPLHHTPVFFDHANRRSREKHLGVVNTILHHMLLKGDYQRAGRAWGMLLRASYTGTDLRRLGRWGIGAELLLRRTNSPDHGADLNQTEEGPSNDADFVFNDANFELAKSYYEKLIIQHPYRQNQPNAIRCNFYPALFSCWIYQVTERSKLLKLRIKSEHEKGDFEGVQDDEDSNSPGHRNLTLRRQMRLVHERELRGAQAIAARFDVIIDSPPHDKNIELLRLRGMISQWISDLLVHDEDAEVDSSESDEDNETYGRQNEAAGKAVERKRNLKRAQDMFARARNEERRISGNTELAFRGKQET